MRTVIAFTVFCACLLTTVQGSAFSRNQLENPDQPGKCLYKDLVISAGETITDRRDCTKLTCSRSASTTETNTWIMSIVGYGCNHASSWPDNCEIQVPDLSKDFPDCCPQLECDGAPEGPVSLVG